MNEVQNIEKVNIKTVSCGKGNEKHPQVYLYLDEKKNMAVCQYCGKKFVYTSDITKK